MEKNIYGLGDIGLGCNPECPPDIPVFSRLDDPPQYIKPKDLSTWPNSDTLENGEPGIIIYGKTGNWYEIRFFDMVHRIKANHIQKFYPYPSINSHLMFNDPAPLYAEPDEKSEKMKFSEADLGKSAHNFLFRVIDKREIEGKTWIKVNAYVQNSDCSRISQSGWMKLSVNRQDRATINRRYCKI